MNIKEIRRNNLRYVIDTFYEGIDSRAAEAIGVAPNQISRCFTDNPKTRRNVGDKIVDGVHRALNKPDGWMDRPQPEPAIGNQAASNTISPTKQKLFAISDNLDDDAIEDLIALAEHLKKKRRT